MQQGRVFKSAIVCQLERIRQNIRERNFEPFVIYSCPKRNNRDIMLAEKIPFFFFKRNCSNNSLNLFLFNTAFQAIEKGDALIEKAKNGEAVE